MTDNNSENFDNRRKPPGADLAKALHKEDVAAAKSLILWANAQDISRESLIRIMSLVDAKIICDTTRHDVFELHNIIDRRMVDLAHNINEHLYKTRSDARVQFKRNSDNG